MRRYDEWRYRVSDILDANLTRTLMLTIPPAEGSKVKRYHVNFTSDLSDTLAEVKHLAVHFIYILFHTHFVICIHMFEIGDVLIVDVKFNDDNNAIVCVAMCFLMQLSKKLEES
jgi:hypothetical protein